MLVPSEACLPAGREVPRVDPPEMWLPAVLPPSTLESHLDISRLSDRDGMDADALGAIVFAIDAIGAAGVVALVTVGSCDPSDGRVEVSTEDDVVPPLSDDPPSTPRYPGVGSQDTVGESSEFLDSIGIMRGPECLSMPGRHGICLAVVTGDPRCSGGR